MGNDIYYVYISYILCIYRQAESREEIGYGGGAERYSRPVTVKWLKRDEETKRRRGFDILSFTLL
jgi:hypothetical protein